MKEKWEIRKLVEVCEIVNGKNQKKVENKNGNYPIMGSGGQMGYADDYLCPIGTIVLGRKGTINNPFIVKENVWLVDTAFGFVADNSILNNRFLFYFCKSFDFTKLNVAVTIPSLRKIDLKKIPIPIPPLHIQEAIVKELDILYRLKELQERQIVEYDNLAQSTFYSMFGDPIENEKGWEVKKLGEVCEIVSGKNQKKVENPKGVYPIMGSGGFMSFADDYLCPEGTVILGRKGTINRPFIVTEKVWMVDTAFGLVVNKSILESLFLFYFCKEFDFLRLNVAVTIPSLRKIDIKKIDLPIPPLSLQNDFAERIEKIEAQKELVKQGIAETQLLIDYTMDKYFG